MVQLNTCSRDMSWSLEKPAKSGAAHQNEMVRNKLYKDKTKLELNHKLPPC